MKKENLIRIIRITGIVYVVCFIAASVVFIVFSDELFRVINALSNYIAPNLPVVYEQGQFYKILALSMMAGVTVCSFLLYRNPNKYITMAIPLVTMKFTSSIFGIITFISGFILHNGCNNLANCVICITDFPLGLWVLYVYYKYHKMCKE